MELGSFQIQRVRPRGGWNLARSLLIEIAGGQDGEAALPSAATQTVIAPYRPGSEQDRNTVHPGQADPEGAALEEGKIMEETKLNWPLIGGVLLSLIIWSCIFLAVLT